MPTERAYYDTEFCADPTFLPGYTVVHPISFGFASDTGREYYAIVKRNDWTSLAGINPWLVDNVYPSLPLVGEPRAGLTAWRLDPDHPEYRHVKTTEQIRDEVLEFLLPQGRAWAGSPELWSNFGCYDHFLLGQLYGDLGQWPAGLHMFDFDLQHELARLGHPDVPEQSAGHHNALADARHNRTVGELLRALADGSGNPRAVHLSPGTAVVHGTRHPFNPTDVRATAPATPATEGEQP